MSTQPNPPIASPVYESTIRRSALSTSMASLAIIGALLLALAGQPGLTIAFVGISILIMMQSKVTITSAVKRSK